MRRVLGYLKPRLLRICLQLFVKFSGTIIELLLPYMLSKIIDDIVPTGEFKLIFLWGGLMILCAGGALLGNVTANRMSTSISKDFTRQLRNDLFERITNLSCAQTDAFTVPSLISRLSSDTYNTHNMVDRMQRLGVRAPILLIGGIIVTFSLEPVLTLVLAATLPLLAIVVWQVTKHGVPLYTKTQQAIDKLVSKVQENMTGVRVIKALSKSQYERERFDEVNKDVCTSERRAERLMTITNPTMNLLLNVGLTVMMVVGAFRVNSGITKPGVIVAFLSYFQIILNALMMVTRLFIIYSKGSASAKRIAEILDMPYDMPVRNKIMVARGKRITVSKLEGDIKAHSRKIPGFRLAGYEKPHITFNDVTFSYNKNIPNAQGISFKLYRGQTLGIIGPTGSGKSTIVQLLMRFYDPDKGNILIDGIPIDSMDEGKLHTRFGVVFQNDFIYADTIGENIDFGRKIEKNAVISAATTAQAGYIFTEKAQGFEEPLNSHGSNLSGGQRQRLLIARAIAARPEILILDDCSSALDYKTDAALRKALRKELFDTTTIIIAQRISSIQHADLILVMDDGKVIGKGTHGQLLENCASYKEIYDVQMGEAV